MKTNLYYQRVYQRRNVLKDILFGFFFAISSWPRLIIEVFTRRNMGERYFKFSSALTVFILLALIPIFSLWGFKRFNHEFGVSTFIRYYFTWYVFLIAFLYMAVQRRNEIRHLPSVFDLGRFSKSKGVIHLDFLRFITRGKSIDIRTIETKLEPGVFFLLGLALAILGQPIGTVIMQCSFIYAFSHRASYYLSDEAVMDRADEMIANEEMTRSMVEGRDASETRGFQFMGRRPANLDDRQRLANAFMQTEETVEAF